MVFAGLAIFVVVMAMHVIKIERGSLPVPPPDSEEALFYFFGLIAFVTLGYMVGKGVARIVRRSQVRFFRTTGINRRLEVARSAVGAKQ